MTLEAGNPETRCCASWPHRRTECGEIHPAQRACWREGLDCLAEGADHPHAGARHCAGRADADRLRRYAGHLPPEAAAGNRDGHLGLGRGGGCRCRRGAGGRDTHKDEAQEAVLARLEEIRQPKSCSSTRSTSSAVTSCWPSRNRSTSAPVRGDLHDLRAHGLWCEGYSRRSRQAPAEGAVALPRG